ncbi:MAG: hypothetical protein LBR67_03650 [Dysgonamonadaceae bacterium]|jgi:Asp-tRNA(Asn)/Glu-tRNA(Gln) amidotransferase C subunit|nr:hypothetical protein [Dysgonamonadaceae bacterium]
MSEIMSLERLSNIKGAGPSESVGQLFEVVRNAVSGQNNPDFIDLFSDNAVTVDDLRDDVVIESTPEEKTLIIANFPNKQHQFLVVPKVIEE